MRSRIFAILFLTIAIAACSQIYGPAKEVEIYGDAVTPVMDELLKTIAADPSEAGVDKAAKLWDSKKPDLKAKRDAIDAGPRGMNSDWMSLLFRINDRANESLRAMSAKVVGSPADAKFKQLGSDIETTLKLR